MDFSLRRDDSVPLYQQLRDGIRSAIDCGRLAPGQRLPSSRQLALDLNVSRITTTAAYSELEADGLIESRRGAGTYVTTPWRPTAIVRAATPSDVLPAWQSELTASSRPDQDRMMTDVSRFIRDGNYMSFGGARGDVRLFPLDLLRRTIADVLHQDSAGALDYELSAGYQPLRQTLANYLRRLGIDATAEDVIVTAGAQQAIDLLTRAITRPGDSVVVESPTYPGALQAFANHGLQLIDIPLDSNGMRIDILRRVLETQSPRLIYTVPTFHNPTGTVLSAARRRELVSLAHHYSIPIIEDDYLREVHFGSPVPPPLAAFDQHGNVIHVGSFSKSILPTMRLGYVVASGPLRERLIALRSITDVCSSSLTQRVLQRFLEDGSLHTYWKRTSRIYRRRQFAMIQALEAHFPVGTSWTVANGGHFLWITLPGEVDVDAVLNDAQAEGVSFSVGSPFFARPNKQPHMRLAFAPFTETEIQHGVQRIGRLAQRYLAVARGMREVS